MKKFVFLLLLFGGTARATTTFYAQTATGTASGADCADATALPSSLSVSAGNIYMYCGTGTYAAGTSAALTLTGGGSAGNPAIFRFAHGAIMQAPYWGQNGAIRVTANYITVDGSPTGTPCGYILGVDTACDGTIQATANGATLANHVAGGKGVWINGGLTGDVVQNVNFQNLFVPGGGGNANNESTGSFSGNTMCVYVDFTSQQITITNNVCNNAHSLVRIGYQGTTGNSYSIENNVFSNTGEGIWIGAGSSGATIDGGGTISEIDNNDFSNLTFDTVPFTTANSSCAAGSNHQEFIHLFTQQTSSQIGTAAAPFQISNNFFHGLLGCSYTSEIYIECDSTAQCGAPNHLFVDLFNNRIASTDPASTLANNNGGNGMSECEGSTCRYVNNTYYSNVGASSSSNFAQHCESGSIVTLENNIFDGMNAAFVPSSCGTVTTTTNLGFGLTNACGSTCTLSGNPLLNTGVTPPYQLTNNTSGAYQTGTNATALGIAGLTTDALNNTRPPTGPWDLGAFEFQTGGTVSISSSTAAFGNEIQNKISPPILITLTNTSGSVITLTGYPITGTNASDFSSQTTCGATLASGSTCTVAPVFTPSAAPGTNETGSLAINYTGFSGPTLTVSLTGTSIAGGPITSYAARTDFIPQPYNGGLGTIPCPGAGGCSSVIITNVSDNGTTATFTCLVPCGFTPGQVVQVNGNSLSLENASRTILTDTGVSFTVAGVTTGNGTDGVVSTGGALTGAGTTIPSDFPGATLIRITDNVTPSIVGGATPGRNGFVTSTTGSAETCQWDISDQRFVIQEVGNASKAFQFNPTTNVATPLYGNTAFDPNGAHEPTCSHVTPFLFYNSEMVGSDLSIVAFDTTSTTTSPTIANGGAHVIVDLNVACGAGLPSGLVASNDEPGVSQNDTVFSAVGQTTPGQNNSIVYMIAWNKITNVCYVWNRQTGHWFINGADQGLVTIHALSAIPPTSYTADTDSEAIHQMRMNQSGTILWQTIETCLPVTPTANCTSGGQNTAWVIGTNTAYQDDIHLNPTAAGNHEAIGLNIVVYGRSFCPTYCDSLYSAPLTNGNSGTLLNFVPNDPAALDIHPNYTNNINDTSPFCTSHTQDNAAGLPQNFNPPYAWRNEITCQSPVAPYPTYRISHTYVSTMAPAGFPSWAAVLTASQDGKYILFPTDWACMLGANNGTGTVANCSSNGTYNARQDVFLVVMPPAGNLPVAPNMKLLVKEKQDDNERKSALGDGSSDAFMRYWHSGAEPVSNSLLLHDSSGSVQH